MNAPSPRHWLAARRRNDWLLGAVALVALALCWLLGVHAPKQALLSYLVAYLFWLAPALGSMALLMVHALTGGEWGVALRPALLAATRRLPLMALLLLPILLGMHALYPWASGAPLADDPNLARQRWYLDEGFFVLRAVVCFALWLGLAWGVQRRARDPVLAWKGFAAAGLIVYALSASVAGVDWIMSLVPRWHSSTFGLLVGTGQLLSALALAVFATVCWRAVGDGFWTSRRLNDMGRLLLVVVLAWSYLAFMDYLTAWIADQPSETVWYLPRLKTGWRWLGAFLVLFHLALPFAVLLSRRAKQLARWLMSVAGLLWVAHLGAIVWLVLPGFRVHGSALAWTDPLALLGVGGLWWPGFTDGLRGVRA